VSILIAALILLAGCRGHAVAPDGDVHWWNMAPPVQAPEINPHDAISALIVLATILAIAKGRR
jgi:hypothetical protein